MMLLLSSMILVTLTLLHHLHWCSAPEVSQRPSPPSIISLKCKNLPTSATQPQSKRPQCAPKAGPTASEAPSEAPTLPLCQSHSDADQIEPVKDAVILSRWLRSECVGKRLHRESLLFLLPSARSSRNRYYYSLVLLY
jgi:hypothetical protein